VRTPSSAYTFKGGLQLQRLNGNTVTQVSTTPGFTANSQWKLITVPLDIHQAGGTALNAVKVDDRDIGREPSDLFDRTRSLLVASRTPREGMPRANMTTRVKTRAWAR
jgi:hypothetical protein